MANAKLIDQSEFLHIPKTGGTWVYRVLQANQLIRQKGIGGHVHATYDMVAFDQAPKHSLRRFKQKLIGIKNNQTFRFCFVRHPLTWYESWWKFMCERGWNQWGDANDPNGWHPNLALNGLGSDDFNQFVQNVINARPGYVSELYFSYVKPGMSFVGKIENLKEDLLAVMAMRKLTINKASVESAKPANASKIPSQPIEWDPELRNTVIQLELPALIHFGYLSAEDADHLGVPPTLKPCDMVRG